MALSNPQLIVLAAACQRPDRSIYPLTTKLPGGAAAKVLGSLLNKNLVKEVPAKRVDTIWREDKKRGRLTLRATPDAFKALGIEESAAGAETQTGIGPQSQQVQAEGPRHACRQQAGPADRHAQAARGREHR
jgi:hypothetical protein